MVFLAAHIFLFFHFIWLAIDHYRTNKIRLTGPKPYTSKPPTFDDDYPPHPAHSDPMQTSFYSWWSKQKGVMNKANQLLNITEDSINTDLKKISEDLVIINNRLEEYSDMIERFDKSFWFHQRSQLFRYWIFETGLPFFLGTISLALLTNQYLKLHVIFC